MVEFKEIPRKGYLPDLVATEMMAQVSSGALQPGDNFPTEIALAEMFGVSRNVVREAIARLRSDGVIESKQGRGAIVRPISERETFRVDLAALASGENFANLFELRGMLEIEAAGLAATRRDDGDLVRIRGALEQMRGTGDFDEQRLKADADFHRALGKATKNEYLATIIDYLSSRQKETIRATGEVYPESDLLRVTLAEHQAVFDAVEAGNPGAARQAMAAHIQGAASRLGVEVPPTV